jgi:HJR/Mrr/RecB family endonuclease
LRTFLGIDVNLEYPELIFVGGLQGGQRVVLTHTVGVFGRDSGADIILSEEYISDCQAQYKLRGNEFILENFSKHGTWINGKRYKYGELVLLETGDVIGMGRNTQILFVAASDDADVALAVYRDRLGKDKDAFGRKVFAKKPPPVAPPSKSPLAEGKEQARTKDVLCNRSAKVSEAYLCLMEQIFGPQPERFGITAQQIETHRKQIAERKKKRDSYFSRAFSVSTLLSGLFVAVVVWINLAGGPTIGRLVVCLFAGFLGLMPGVILGVIVGFSVLAAVDFFSKDEKTLSIGDAVTKFDQAVLKWKEVQEREKEAKERAKRDFWKNLSGYQFETELAKLFRVCGSQVVRTSMSGDGGVDLWLFDNGKKIIVQCKCHEKPVGVAAVRDLFGTMTHHKADKAILASVSDFTSGVRKFIKEKPIELLGLDDILRLAADGGGEDC